MRRPRISRLWRAPGAHRSAAAEQAAAAAAAAAAPPAETVTPGSPPRSHLGRMWHRRQLITLAGSTAPIASGEPVMEAACLICDHPLGPGLVRLVTLAYIPPGMPSTWGLPARAYFVHGCHDITDTRQLHWLAHYRNHPGCECSATRPPARFTIVRGMPERADLM